jgi:hypothetical protein
MTSLNEFGLNIVSDTASVRAENINGAQYFFLPNHTEYSIVLTNSRPMPADAKIKIDGVSIGEWRLKPYDTFKIERPAEQSRKFTFIADHDFDARRAGVSANDSKNGLISVTFKPQKQIDYIKPQPYVESAQTMKLASNSQSMMRPQLMKSIQNGVTLLGQVSDQKFGQTPMIPEDMIDRKKITKIVVRLEVENSNQLSPRYKTKVPPRLGM